MGQSKSSMTNLVELNQGFLRSVHIERDFYSEHAGAGYLITRGSRAALSLLSRGFSEPSYRAQCVSGPYGSGKSALALYFSRLLDKDLQNGLRDKARHDLGGGLGKYLPPDGEGYITILATGKREATTATLLNGLKRSLELSGRRELFRKLLRRSGSTFEALQNDTRLLVKVFEDLAVLAVEQEHSLGTIVIIDELGKLLEYAALNPEAGDVHLLQEMAEAASRSTHNPIWFITVLHQQFSQYASHLGPKHQQEWAKVQQRFYDVPCLLDVTDTLQLISAALDSSSRKKVAANPRIRNTSALWRQFAPKGSESDFDELSIACYPLHPATLLVLPALFKKLGQNERSLFSFLSANEPHSLTDWARHQGANAAEPMYYRLPELFDYARSTLIGGATAPYLARIWTETEDALSRLGDGPTDELRILKTIALLGLVGDSARLTPSREILCGALVSGECSEDSIDRCLDNLIRKRLVVFRRFRNAFRLWEGSDVDIEERLLDARQEIPTENNVLTVAREKCAPSSLVARRHAFQTGMPRAFAVLPCAVNTLEAACGEGDSEGRVVQCLVENVEQQEHAESLCRELRDPSVIVLIGKSSEELEVSAGEVMALEWVRQNTPLLAGDRVARQEIEERSLEAEMAFRAAWQKAFGFGSPNTKCYWKGRDHPGIATKAFVSLLSDACDATFPYAPRVKNELINRKQLSSAAAAGRRNLIEAMISHHSEPTLGMSGYQPARSIYASLLAETKIHRQDEAGHWIFSRPDESDPGLRKAWDCIATSAESGALHRRQVSVLFDILERPPYGLAAGFLPVFLCAYLLANSSSMALYEEDAFVPELSTPIMERLMRKPGKFSFVEIRLAGQQMVAVERFAKGFQVDPGVLPIVNSLYSRMRALPKYAEVTRNLPPKALLVRDAILRAKSPEQLLFADLPASVGTGPITCFDTQSDDDENTESFFAELNHAFEALLNCYSDLLVRIKASVLSAFDLPESDKQWRQNISDRADRIFDSVSDPWLKAILVRARDRGLPEAQYLEAVAAGVLGQPPAQWTTAEEEAFRPAILRLKKAVIAAVVARELEPVLRSGEDGLIISIGGKNGTISRGIASYSKAEKAQVDLMIESVSKAMRSGASQRIKLAAVAEVTRRMISGLSDEVPASRHPRALKEE